jgi:hypothetical protein
MFSIEGQEKVSKEGYPSFQPPRKTQPLDQGSNYMNDKQKKVLLNFARTLAATVVAALIAWVAGPDAAELIGAQTAVIAVPVLTALLTAAERALRYGNEEGEDKTLSLVGRKAA